MKTRTDIAWRPDELIRRWHTLLAGARLSYWPGVFGTLVALGLLGVFHQVVSGSVYDSEQRLKMVAVHAKATWRCKTMGDPSARDHCLAQIEPVLSRNAQASPWEEGAAPTVVAGP